MKIFLKYLGWGCLGLILSVMNAQFAAQNMKSSSKIPVTKSLLLGEKVPDNLWFKPLKIINGTKETLSLSDFKESLVILEFWASNCSACLKNIPKVAEINNQFKDSAIILPVSEQPKNAIAKFFEGEYGRNYKDLISVTDDSILGKYFPHYGVPYLVWIYDGKVMSTTDAGQLSAESVSDILQKKNLLSKIYSRWMLLSLCFLKKAILIMMPQHCKTILFFQKVPLTELVLEVHSENVLQVQLMGECSAIFRLVIFSLR